MCVFDGTYYKITTTNYISKTSLYTIFRMFSWGPGTGVCVFDGTYYKITTTNYISKTSLYTTFHMFSSGPWPLKILKFALLVTCEIATSANHGKRPETTNIPQMPLEQEIDDQEIDDHIDIKILWVPPPGAGRAFPRQ